MRHIKALILSLACILTITAHAQKVDGILNEPEWQTAKIYENFIITSPKTNEKPKFSTKALIYTTHQGIHVGFINEQPIQDQTIKKHRRDGFSYSDFNIVNVDFDNKSNTAYQFLVSLGDSIKDGILSNENVLKLDWDGDWLYATHQSTSKWTSELLLPWSIASFNESTGPTRKIKIHFARWLASTNITYSFPDAHYNRPTYISDFYEIEIPNYENTNFTISPYILNSNHLTTEDTNFKAGLDFSWKPNVSSSVSGTINPDFGQVETDELIVNFSAIESLRTDKRPFFTENAESFHHYSNDNLKILHTRRMGAESEIASGISYRNIGEEFNSTFMVIQEDDSQAYKGNHYFASKIKFNSTRFSVGHTLTYANSESKNAMNVVNGLDFKYLSESNSVTNFLAVQSYTEAYGDLGLGFMGSYQKRLYDSFNLYTELTYLDEKLNINKTGFLARNNLKGIKLGGDYEIKPKLLPKNVLQRTYYINANYQENTYGVRLIPQVDISLWQKYKDTSSVFFKYKYEFEGTDDLLTFGNGQVKLNPRHSIFSSYDSPSKNNLSFSPSFKLYQEGNEGYAREYAISLKWYANTDSLIELKNTYIDSDDWLIWRSNSLNSYKRKAHQSSVKISYTPSFKQDFRAYIQWYALKSTGVEQIYSLSRGQSVINKPENFSYSNVGIQFRYRYEIAPLSNLYIIYNRDGKYIADDAQGSFDSLIQESFNEPDEDALYIKINYRF